jgi:hypothetical protein
VYGKRENLAGVLEGLGMYGIIVKQVLKK